MTPRVVMEAIALGATAVIADEAIETQLPHAVQQALAGMVWLPTSVMPLLARALQDAPPSDAPSSARAALSQRETEVLELAAKGYSNREIAERLGIATKTVETYKHRVKLRSNASGRRALVELAEREGLLHRFTPPGPPPPPPPKYTHPHRR
ncbi:MAG: response regulator transcription factor [Gemmatimonadota bacterium]|nr:response regulator transcription factor [Gemmatimonadota bacterium]